MEGSMMEERDSLMASARAGERNFRRAHFLTTPDNHHHQFAAIPHSSTTTTHKSLPKVAYQGWRGPQIDWERWVLKLEPLYGEIWKSAGIYEAIKCSTYTIVKGRGNKNLVSKLAQKWCPETNTFVFPWGECTVTLEDVMVLGGFSVLGDLYFRPYRSEDMVHLENRLKDESSNIWRNTGKYPGESTWLQHFIGRGSERLEHEAFLVLWLTRFVFPTTVSLIDKGYFLLAINLSRGSRFAFGPAVLASIYSDLGSLKRASMVGTSSEPVKLKLCSLLGIVQVWAWERFSQLRPEPNLLEPGEPRLARWRGVIPPVFIDSAVDQVLSSSVVDFEWRPYARNLENWDSNKLYDEKYEGYHVMAGPDMDSEVIKALVRCWRNSELVGGMDCVVEQYLPHRVGMQFGFDQDLPLAVGKISEVEIPELAWSHYNRLLMDAKLFIPPRLRQPSVTRRYQEEWIRAQAGSELTLYLGEASRADQTMEGIENASFDHVYMVAEPERMQLSSGEANEVADDQVQMAEPERMQLCYGEANEVAGDQVQMEAEPERMEICEEDPVVENKSTGNGNGSTRVYTIEEVTAMVTDLEESWAKAKAARRARG